jgi:hypothetical protein
LAGRYDTSKEATARWFIQFRDEPCAVVIGRNDEILRYYKNDRFPYIIRAWGDRASDGLLATRDRLAPGDISDWRTALANDWVGVERGQPASEVFEQVHAQRDGFWLALLQIEQRDEDEEEDEGQLRESWRVTFRR